MAVETRKPWSLFRVARETRRIQASAESTAPGIVTRREIAQNILSMNTGINSEMIPLLTEKHVRDSISSRLPKQTVE